MEFPAVVMEEVMLAGGSKIMKASHMYKPQAWRWLNVKPPPSMSLVKVLDKEGKFCFRPYYYTPQDMPNPTLYGVTNEEIELLPRDGTSVTLCFVAAPTFLPYNLEPGEDVIVYNPQHC